MEKEYVMLKDFCILCGICPSTGCKLIKHKQIKFKRCIEGRLHYYKIPMSEVIRYKKERELRGHLSDEEVEIRKNYYRRKMTDYPELLNANDIQQIIGYGKESIRNWINSEKILGVVVRKRFCVAKEDLLDFLVSPYYENIIRKCKEHKKDCKNIKKITSS